MHSASGVTHATYRYASQLPLRASADTLYVNWCELTLTNAAGTQLYHTAFMTQAPLTAKTVAPLVQAGRTPAELSREFGVTAQSIAAWVAQAAANSGKPVRGKDVLSSAERDELMRLRRENKRLQQERDILAKATAWFAGRNGSSSNS